MGIILAILMGFAWAIGGEHGFGKWKRGLLVGLVTAVFALLGGYPWYFYLFLVFLSWGIYQALFYDECIQMVWAGTDIIEQAMGFFGLFLNGLLCGAIPAWYYWVGHGFSWLPMLGILVLSGVGFIGAAISSNCFEWSWGPCKKIGLVKVWCPADSWWWACWLYGLLLGVITWVS